MAVKSDKYGFLIGDGAESWPTAIDQWADIAKDVRLIRMLLEGDKRRNAQQVATPKRSGYFPSSPIAGDISTPPNFTQSPARNDKSYRESLEASAQTKAVTALLKSQNKLNRALLKPVSPGVAGSSSESFTESINQVTQNTTNHLNVSRIVGKVDVGSADIIRTPRLSSPTIINRSDPKRKAEPVSVDIKAAQVISGNTVSTNSELKSATIKQTAYSEKSASKESSAKSDGHTVKQTDTRTYKQTRDYRKRSSTKSSSKTATNSRDSSKVSTKEKLGKSTASPKPSTGRDENGRFVAQEQTNSSLMVKAISKLGYGINNVFDGKDDIDPAIAAAKEIAGPVIAIAKPIGASFKFLGSRNKEAREVAWYKKIYRQMVYSRRDENAWNKKQLQKLKDIEERSRSGETGFSIFSILSTMSGVLTGIAGTLVSILSAVAVGRLAGRVLGRGGRGAGGAGGAGGGGGAGALGKLLKKVPLLAALYAAGSIAISELDDDLSRAEKNINIGDSVGTAGGAAAGALGGAAAGSAIFPGVGTAIGAAAGAFFGSEAGSIIGRYAGEFFNPERIDSLFAGIQSTWSDAVSLWDDSAKWVEEKKNDIIEEVSNAFESANSTVEEYTGVNVAETSEKLATTSKEVATEVKEVATDTFNKIDESIKDAIGVGPSDVVTTASSGAVSIFNWFGEGVEYAKRKLSPEPVKSHSQTDATDQTSTQNEGGRKKVVIDWDGKKKPEKPNKVAEWLSEKVTQAKEKITGTKSERWDSAKTELVDAANFAGVDAGTLAAIANFESGFNSDARPVARDSSKNKIRQYDGKMAISSAHGYGQFLDATWMETMNKHGAKYGIEGAGSLTAEQANKYRGNTKIQAAMLAELTKENIAKGKKLGGPDELANVYALHNLGAGDGPKMLNALRTNPDAQISSILSKRVIGNNPSLYKNGKISVRQAYAMMGNKMREGSSYTAEARELQRAVNPVNKVGSVKSANAGRIPSAPSVIPKIPKIASASQVMPPNVSVDAPVVRAGNANASANVRVKPADERAGRDLPIRDLAHIVTGGIAH